MNDTNRLLDFIKLTYEVRKVQRKIAWTTGGHENDAEHQFQMAICALFIIEKNNLKLDKYRCAAMGLVHDVVESYAGDVSVFADKKDLESKIRQEQEALAQIKKDWAEAPDLLSLIDEYEARQTPEAKFVYALDKLLPEINNYLNDGLAWKQQGISVEQVEQIKIGKVDIDPTIAAYHKDVLEMIKAHPELFGDQKL